MPAPGPVHLVTGATGLLGGAAVERLLRADPTARVVALVRDPARWTEWWTARAAASGVNAARVTPLAGDLTRPGLGLDAAARGRLAREVTGVLHLAADTTFSRPLDEARAVNAEGTRRLLELAADIPGARRFAHVSTAFVAGRMTGRVPESEHDGAAGWVNAYERSKWEAERLVREWGGATGREWVILRSSTVVCDDARGGVTQRNAVHRALRLYHAGLAAMMPAAPESALDVVPADYVADAVAALAFRDDVAGESLHLCAGDRAYPLDALLDETYALWARCPEWRRRGIARPALTDAATYALFERAVEETGDARLRGVTRSLSHFVPQLALPKRFDTARAERALGHPAPDPREYWGRMVEGLMVAGLTESGHSGRPRGRDAERGAGSVEGAALGASRVSPATRSTLPAPRSLPRSHSLPPRSVPPAAERSFTTAMLAWLNARFAPPGVTITADAELFRGGLIDSIRILELIAWTERATGREVPDAEIRMDNFRTVARIAEVFARDGAAAEVSA